MITIDDRKYLTDYFHTEEIDHICQADLVLALLRDNRLTSVEYLIGKPITRCPSAMPPRIPLPAKIHPHYHIRRIRLPVHHNEGSKRFDYLERLHTGMTLDQVFARIPRRYLWWGVRHHYVELSR